MHEKMTGVMGSKNQKMIPGSTSELSESELNRKARYQQSLINAGMSFLVMIMAAQAVRVAGERRRLQRKVEDLSDGIDQVKARVLDKQSIQHITKKIVERLSTQSPKPLEEKSSAIWFASKQDRQAPIPHQQVLESEVSSVLFDEIKSLLEEATLPDDERKVSQMDEIQKELGDAVFLELKGQDLSIEEDGNSTIVRKKVFSL